MRLKVLLAALVMLGLSVRSASAQWSGGYAGGDVGLAWGTSTGTSTNSDGNFPVPYDFKTNGFLYGFFVGGNWQQNRLAIGGEFDWQLSRAKGDSGLLVEPITLTEYTFTTKAKSNRSIRGRLGVAAGNVLIFGTAGWAWSEWSTEHAFATSVATPYFINEVKENGLTFGGGAEWIAGTHLLMRAEYRYLPRSTVEFSDVATNAGDLGNKFGQSDIRFGIGVKF